MSLSISHQWLRREGGWFEFCRPSPSREETKTNICLVVCRALIRQPDETQKIERRKTLQLKSPAKKEKERISLFF